MEISQRSDRRGVAKHGSDSCWAVKMTDFNAVAIIPARGGSQRLPRKNIYPVLGKPMLAWSVQAARGCPYLGPGAVFVSTDDTEIAAVAEAAGAGVIHRPADLATAKVWT